MVLHMLQGGLTSKPSEALTTSTHRRRDDAENGPPKVTKHFSLRLDGKMTCNLCHGG